MFEKLRSIFLSTPEKPSWFAAHKIFFIKIAFVILGSYLLATGVNATLLPKMTKAFSSPTAKIKNLDTGGENISIKNTVNYHDVKKAVLDRNVFNVSGELPKEESDEGDKGKGVFDINGPCEKTSLKIKLLGMIAMEGRGSIATIKDESFDGADVYSEGDFIIGSDTAQIVKMERNNVIINNGGRKECLELKLGDEKLLASIGSSTGGGMQSVGGEESVVDLDASYITSQLGEGFGKIIQSARLVPNTVNNQVNGFKVFGIEPGTLLDKAGFKDNDVITKVNNTVMEAEQGFALYQALNDEKQIRVNVLRNGSTPKTIVIRVK